MADPAGDVKLQIEQLRKKLLDLSRRNRMLCYRPSKRSSVELPGESSFYLHKLLVEEGKRMSFVGQPDPPRGRGVSEQLFAAEDEVALAAAREAAEDELNAFLENAALPVDQMDTKLSCQETESILQAKLRTMQREAASANEELGINTLFLTLGMLEWSEVEGKVDRAPLVFVPVLLEKQANGSMRLRHDGSDPGTNLPLRAKLTELNLKLPEWEDEKTLLDYFSEVESTIRTRADWHVQRDTVSLGFFNYEKYVMYVDLGGEAWPEAKKPWDNPDLRAIFGDGYASEDSPISDGTFLDGVRPASECREVFDADSSQTIALIRAAAGLSIVVEGPPGTGKSQTITNVIAEAVAAGKSVLFVSAKRAALEVVKRNLERAELGPICLDLHDKLTNRREFYAEIKRTVERGVQAPAEEARVQRLTELRNRLNDHSDAVNLPLTEYGCTPFAAMCRLAGLPEEQSEDREGRIAFENLRAKSYDDIRRAEPVVRSLQAHLCTTGVPVEHPFWGCGIDYLDPAKRLDLEVDLRTARGTIARALEDWARAAPAFQIEVAPSFDNLKLLRECADLAREAPDLRGVNVGSTKWITDEQTIRAVIADLRLSSDTRRSVASSVHPSIWSHDLTGIESALAQHGHKWFRFLIPPFGRANNALFVLVTNSAPADPAGRLELVRSVRKVSAAEERVLALSESMRSLIGRQWEGLATQPSTLERLLEWVLGVHKSIGAGRLPTGLLDLFTDFRVDENREAAVLAVEKTGEVAREAYRAVQAELVYPDDSTHSEGWDVLASRLLGWEEGLPALPDYIAYLDVRRQALDIGLAAIVEIADRWPLAHARLLDTFIRSYLSGVVREAMQTRPSLRTFDRSSHEAAIEDFKGLDDFKLRYNQAQVRLAHCRRLPTFQNAAGNLNLLRLQCELTRRHKPIRWAMKHAGEAIQRIKPVCMMSPLTVAIHLPPELPPFDLVIFDEASQIKPEDALCAIARAKQCIVVGDTRQMPPTTFFDRLVDDESEPESDEGAEIGREATKLESILKLMSAVVIGRTRRPDLRWHYRSIHPSLIQPSNEMFYDNRLVVFPSPSARVDGKRIGLELHHHPETVYEAGAIHRINRSEAELVADRVLELLTSCPEESLFVAAMNKPQADLIDREVEKRERLNPAAFAEYRRRHPHEKLEVKNLEMVQGDERDVVLISVTYGRDSSGVIRQHYGPLLQDGGERRLNVLFTRARRRCEVFSNLNADDIRIDRPREGVVALKRYLRFAESGTLDTAIATGANEESPFEEEVTAVLRAKGYEVHCQVGSEGFRIDIGVIDPAKPGRYILGVECDGATYHSARSARDRDKLRQRVLEGRGWKLHRIWSHDWWQNRDGEIRRLLLAIETAGEADIPAPVSEPAEPMILNETAAPPLAPLTRPYDETPRPETVFDESGLGEYVLDVAKVEGPISRDLLFIRVRDAAGYQSARSGTRDWLNSVIDRKLSSVKQFSDAIYAEDTQLYLPRDWSERPASEKKIEYVTEAEIAAAIKAVVRQSFGVNRTEAEKAALRTLGFRSSAGALGRVGQVLRHLLDHGSIREEGGYLQATMK